MRHKIKNSTHNLPKHVFAIYVIKNLHLHGLVCKEGIVDGEEVLRAIVAPLEDVAMAGGVLSVVVVFTAA